ncbi:hypothetical protein CH72_2799 [Burkholderia ambifaria AMMD]|nr:hypothetical protein CH72_2799 [Burkholderia ambifaria AMMD]
MWHRKLLCLLDYDELEAGVQCHVKVLELLEGKAMRILRQEQGMDDSRNALGRTWIAAFRVQVVQR